MGVHKSSLKLTLHLSIYNINGYVAKKVFENRTLLKTITFSLYRGFYNYSTLAYIPLN